MHYLLIITAMAINILNGCAPVTSVKTTDKTVEINTKTFNLDNLDKYYNEALQSKKEAIKKANSGEMREAVLEYNEARSQFDKVYENLKIFLSLEKNKRAATLLYKTKFELDNVKRDLALILYFEKETEKIFGPKRATIKYIDN